MLGNLKRAGVVAGIYALFGMAWILLSDGIVKFAIGDVARLSQVQTLKGFAYILVTAGLVFYLTQMVLRRQAEMFRAVDESERRFRDMFEQAAVGIGLVAPNGRWLRVNQRLCGFLGYSREELLEGTFQGITHPDDLEAMEGLTKELNAGTRNAFQQEVRFVTKAGECAWARVSVSSSRGGDGANEFNIAVIEDIGPSKRAEDAREKLESQFRHAQKMEAVGRLAGSIAHDFNNMLSVILGYTEFAMARLGKSHELYTDLEQVQLAGQRSTALTRQLLAFARKESIAPMTLDLNAHVKESAKILSRLLGENVELIITPGDALWKIHIDPSQLDQLLANLAVNSRDAISGDGQAHVRTANVSFAEDTVLSARKIKAGDYVLLTFSDSGCGMSEELQQHVFEPFFTTKDRDKGTGLGLSTVYGIVEQNHGYIVIDSKLGAGTTFSIYLPRHEEGAAVSGERDEAAAGGSETIFLIEEEAQIKELCRRQLEELGYKVFAFGEPASAVRAAAAFSLNRIDLLVTDVRMAGMNGPDVGRVIRAVWPKTSILFMSGDSESTLAEHGIAPEEMNFIQKPFTPQLLAERVRQILDKARSASRAAG